ncbi:MAG: histone deacetylase [Anaerolineae bacterium]|nr:MAG: histone deacetylase [Anaerolineae bacterium]
MTAWVFYHDIFDFPLPPGHRFPLAKYVLLRQHLLAENLLAAEELAVPPAAGEAQLCLAHDADYVQRALQGGLSAREVRRIGLPWSPQLAERARRSVGSTLAAATAALQDGLGVNLGGGTHHAHRDHGKGYCLFNDVAVAAHQLLAEGVLQRALVVDCDVHQGDGTAEIFAADERVFTFSIHGAKNFPFTKFPSDLDIPLPDGTGDDVYLEALQSGLERAFLASRPQLVFYLAGADPYAGDRLGRLALSMQGLQERDRLVLERCRQAGLPLVITLGGGYGRRIEDTVEIYGNTVRQALITYRSRQTS